MTTRATIDCHGEPIASGVQWVQPFAMDRSCRFPLLLPWCALALCFTACDKVWEAGRSLKAPEAPVVAPPPPPEIPPPPAKVEPAPVFNPQAQISILGYHDFSATRPSSDMVIHPDRLRAQMELIRRSRIPVVRMSDYLLWKTGRKNLPDAAIVITCDDGWEGVYTEAFPIFKEYGFPFSIYLYQNYLGGSGRSLSVDEIREMMAHGCEVGCHSASHDDLTRTRPDLDTWLQQELTGSLEFLRSTFGVENVLPVFAYPYGKYNTRILEGCAGAGYELGLTVAPKKAAHGEPNLELGRFIIHGDDDTNFNQALTFKGTVITPSAALSGLTDVALRPGNQSMVTTRFPRIEADLSQVQGIDPNGVTMRVSGFGEVPCTYDPESGRLHFQPVEPLRARNVQVLVRFQRKGQEKADTIKWSFSVDLEKLYFEGSAPEMQQAPVKSPEPGS
jgi:peptidoglycan/xylan/chitin deacetylase (PgdA/CDA1 family)